MAHPSCPVQFVTTYSSGNDSDPNALCEDVQVEEEGDSRLSWIVTATFTTLIKEFADLGNPPGTNPLFDPPKESFSFDQFTTVARKAVKKFINGLDQVAFTQQPSFITNTLGEVFRPGVEVDECRAVYVVQRNESYPNLGVVMSCVNTVNLNSWKGCGPRTVKCKSITSGEIQHRNNIPFYPVRYEFHLNPDTWDLRVLNKGTKYKDDNGKLQCVKPGEEPVTIYTGFDSFSSHFRDRKIPPDLSTTVDLEEAYCHFRYYRELDFSIFNF